MGFPLPTLKQLSKSKVVGKGSVGCTTRRECGWQTIVLLVAMGNATLLYWCPPIDVSIIVLYWVSFIREFPYKRVSFIGCPL